MRKFLSIFIILALALSLGGRVTAAPSATFITTTPTGYTCAGDVEYVTATHDGSTVVANWGARGEECTFLSSYAQDYYTGDCVWDVMSALSGGTSTSDAPDSQLYQALQELMADSHTTLTSYGDTRYLFCYTDCTAGDYSTITCFYTGNTLSGTWDSGKTWNREHTWPKSKTDYPKVNNNSVNEASDLMSLRPTASSENSSRGNKAYGESSGYYDPGVSVRGDCARILLYVYVRWGNTENMWGSDGVMESLDILLQWMEEDPVDTWEMGRNDAVQSVTGVRNVFVDYPEYAWLLFGLDVPEGLTTPSGEDAAPAQLGDVNSDGVVNHLDAMLVAQYYVSAAAADSLNLAVADVNFDQTINHLDAMLIAQFYVGAIDGFESPKPSCAKGLEYRVDYNQFIGDICVITGIGTCTDEHLVIPSEIDGIPVKVIGKSAFSDVDTLISVQLPTSVNIIEQSAFFDCNNLETVSMPNVTRIYSYAFGRCFSLNNVTLPNSLDRIGVCAFGYCSSLQSIVIPYNVSKISDQAFLLCENLTIYCEIDSIPFGWTSNWNLSNYDGSYCQVVWNYDGANEIIRHTWSEWYIEQEETETTGRVMRRDCEECGECEIYSFEKKKVMYGASADDNLMDGTELNFKYIEAKEVETTVFAEENQYIYYYSPVDWEECIFIVGGWQGGFCCLGKTTIDGIEYYVYRSDNHSLGEVTFYVC